MKRHLKMRDSRAGEAHIEGGLRPATKYLAYTPPYDWDTILASFRTHQVPDLEAVDEFAYERVIGTALGTGWLRITHDPERTSLRLQVWNADSQDVAATVKLVRRKFDLDADLEAIASAMTEDRHLLALWKGYPGLRIPRSWNGFESMVTTVLGQLVSVSFGRTLTRELMEAAGTKANHPRTGDRMYLFPTVKQLLSAELSKVRTSESRRNAIRSLAALVADGTLEWEQPINHDKLRKILLSVPGIGPWTAEYVAMHGFHDDDAFPATDYGLKQQLKLHPEVDVKKVRPWRAYAAIALWKEFAHSI
jgi:3-methyladenine DNA glycosylase/8-oxoguanine DNA glycosylase